MHYEIRKASELKPYYRRLQVLRLDGMTGMCFFLEDVLNSPEYMEKNARIAFCWKSNELVGWATVCLDCRGQVRFNCFVEEKHRSQGIGTQLVKKLSTVYHEVASIPPTIAQRYQGFYRAALPELFVQRAG